MFDFQQVGYDLQKLSQQIEALSVKPAKQRLNTKKSVESGLLFEFTPLNLHRVQSVFDQLQNSVKELLALYSTIYRFFNSTTPVSIKEYTETIDCLKKISDRLDNIKPETSTRAIIDKTKKLYLDIKDAIEEAFKATLSQKILLQLEVLWANQKPNQWLDILKGSSFENKMMHALEILLEQVIQQHSEVKTLSPIEKSFLNQINKQELAALTLRGMKNICVMTSLTSQYDGIYLEYSRQNHHSNCYLTGGGCQGAVIDWGRKLVEHLGTSVHSLKAYEETLNAFQNNRIPTHLNAFYFMTGESPLNPRANLYQLNFSNIVIQPPNFFDWSKDGHVAEKIIKFFSDKEKFSILEVQIRNSVIEYQTKTVNHSMGIAKIVTPQKTLYYLKDAYLGECKFYDLAQFQKWLHEYFSIMKYDSYQSYMIRNISSSIIDLINGKRVLLSNLEDVMQEIYTINSYLEENYHSLVDSILNPEEEKQEKNKLTAL